MGRQKGTNMVVSLQENAQQDLIDRGFSRRNFGKIAALLGAAAASPTAFIGTAEAQQQAARSLKGGTIIGANECWTGPFASGVQAIAKYAASGNRYDPDDLKDKLITTVASTEGVPSPSSASGRVRVARWSASWRLSARPPRVWSPSIPPLNRPGARRPTLAPRLPRLRRRSARAPM
jgi:hypothetical protein